MMGTKERMLVSVHERISVLLFSAPGASIPLNDVL
jgi:hypothetical protein